VAAGRVTDFLRISNRRPRAQRGRLGGDQRLAPRGPRVSAATSGSLPAVLWYAGQLIDRFASFDEYFVCMIPYVEKSAEKLSRALGRPHTSATPRRRC
jgi:hypothetical protein